MRTFVVWFCFVCGFAWVHAWAQEPAAPSVPGTEASAVPGLISTAAVTSEPSVAASTETGGAAVSTTTAEVPVSTAPLVSVPLPPKTMEELAARQAARLKEFMAGQAKAKLGLEAQLQAERRKLEEEARSLPMAERRKKVEELRGQSIARKEELRLKQAAEKEDFRLDQKRERDDFRKSRR